MYRPRQRSAYTSWADERRFDRVAAALAFVSPSRGRSDHTVALIDRVRRLIGETDTEFDFQECRQCGTTLEPGADRCEACGSDDVVRYVID